jgi:hypothetical protein
LESVCWGNSTVGSNPTLSAIVPFVKAVRDCHLSSQSQEPHPCKRRKDGAPSTASAVENKEKRGKGGPPAPNTIDYGPGDPSQTLLNDSNSCACIEAKLDEYQRKIKSANIPYNPFSTNSNAYAHGAIGAAGLPEPKPPVSVPGWNKVLGVH